MGRSPCCDKTMVKKGPWSHEEDDLLHRFLTKFGNGGNWISLPKKAGLNRCGKSCRLRWLNYLRPNIKHGDFTEDEDQIIYMLYNIVGSRWSVIASKLRGRTDNDVKNYWNTKLRRKILSGKFKNVSLNGIPNSNYGTQTHVNTNYNALLISQISNGHVTNYYESSQNKDNIISSELNQDHFVLDNSSEVISRSYETREVSSQYSETSSNTISSSDGLKNEFWMDLFSESFDEDNVVVGSKLVEDKINEISSLLHAFVD